MSEIGWAGMLLCKLVVLAIVSFLYGIGGSNYGELKKLRFIPECLCKHPKTIRRYIASFVLAVSVYVSAAVVGRFSWWMLLYYPLLVGAWSLPYGADKLSKKIVYRSIYGTATAIAGVAIVLNTAEPRWALFCLQVWFAVLGNVILGAFNPTEEASTEQGLICMVSNWGVLFYV